MVVFVCERGLNMVHSYKIIQQGLYKELNLLVVPAVFSSLFQQ